MKNNKKQRKLKKSIREALQVITIGTIGALVMVSVWIGSVIQTMEVIG
jgi:hypothetical protein